MFCKVTWGKSEVVLKKLKIFIKLINPFKYFGTKSGSISHVKLTCNYLIGHRKSIFPPKYPN